MSGGGRVVAIGASTRAERRLQELAEELEATRWAFEIIDARWHLFYVSEEMRSLLRRESLDELPCGEHFVASRYDGAYKMVSDPSRRDWLRLHVPFMLHDDPGSRERIEAMTIPEHRDELAGLEPRPAPPRWVADVAFEGREFTGSLKYIGERVLDERGEVLGYLIIYGPSLPASVLGLLTRGDASMFERMASLADPGRRQAAVLFGALDDSTALSRRLPSAVYFDLIRRLVTEMDEVVVQGRGLVGKHTGDGVTAFFLVDDHGSRSAAARLAIETAREIARVAEQVGQATQAGKLLGPDGWRLNIGLHWGSTLYIGQIATGGRLEVAALGDEFNEALRLQQTARDGATLASKALLERLDADDAMALGIDPDRTTYTTLAELPSASDKAIRDAGTLAVTDVALRADAP
ncbi:MAG: adenylate cyclase [Thermoleophilaceae bacterium]|nr:adenylate cyclase [Thermoleophilaceae bacterium]